MAGVPSPRRVVFDEMAEEVEFDINDRPVKTLGSEAQPLPDMLAVPAHPVIKAASLTPPLSRKEISRLPKQEKIALRHAEKLHDYVEKMEAKRAKAESKSRGGRSARDPVLLERHKQWGSHDDVRHHTREVNRQSSKTLDEMRAFGSHADISHHGHARRSEGQSVPSLDAHNLPVIEFFISPPLDFPLTKKAQQELARVERKQAEKRLATMRQTQKMLHNVDKVLQSEAKGFNREQSSLRAAREKEFRAGMAREIKQRKKANAPISSAVLEERQLSFRKELEARMVKEADIQDRLQSIRKVDFLSKRLDAMQEMQVDQLSDCVALHKEGLEHNYDVERAALEKDLAQERKRETKLAEDSLKRAVKQAKKESRPLPDEAIAAERQQTEQRLAGRALEALGTLQASHELQVESLFEGQRRLEDDMRRHFQRQHQSLRHLRDELDPHSTA